MVDEVIRNAWLPKRPKYGLDDFIKIFEELKKKGGRTRIVGLTGITQARCYRTLKMIEERKYSTEKI